MKTINDQPRELLARYADRTGAKFEYEIDKKWLPSSYGGQQTAQWHIEKGLKIRLVLTHGLPSHLPPYKENPRDPGEGYRVPTGGDSCDQEHQMYTDSGWLREPCERAAFKDLAADYRLPATVMPPDWEEMTRGKKPEIGDQCPLCKDGKLELEPQKDCSCHISAPCHHCTDRELRCDTCLGDEKVVGWKSAQQPDSDGWIPHVGDEMPCDGERVIDVKFSGGGVQLKKKASSWVWAEIQLFKITHWRYADQIKEAINTQPTIGVLRPISEMPDEVPAGCVRIYASVKEGELESGLTRTCFSDDTHAADIQLPAPPDPLAEERAAFETWWSKQPERSGKHKAECFEAWKGAKGL